MNSWRERLARMANFARASTLAFVSLCAGGLSSTAAAEPSGAELAQESVDSFRCWWLHLEADDTEGTDRLTFYRYGIAMARSALRSLSEDQSPANHDGVPEEWTASIYTLGYDTDDPALNEAFSIGWFGSGLLNDVVRRVNSKMDLNAKSALDPSMPLTRAEAGNAVFRDLRCGMVHKRALRWTAAHPARRR